MILSAILIIVIWILPINTNNRIFNQREQSDLLKFIVSIIVVLGHQIIFYCSLPQFMINETNYGATCVAFFLFMSGYGLVMGRLQIKEEDRFRDYSWLSKRLVKLIIPAITAMVVYLMFKFLLGESINWIHVLRWWFVSDENLKYGWYVSEIIVLYVAFYFCFRYMRMPYSIYSLTTLIIIAITMMISYKIPVWYIRGLPCFILGLFFAKYDIQHQNSSSTFNINKIKSVIIKSGMTMLIICFFLLNNFQFIQKNIPALDRWKYMYISFYVNSPIILIVIIYIIKRMPSIVFLRNKGRYFYEIYLVQGASLILCRKLIENDLLFIVTSILITIIMAKYLNKVNNIIIKKLYQYF